MSRSSGGLPVGPGVPVLRAADPQHFGPGAATSGEAGADEAEVALDFLGDAHGGVTGTPAPGEHDPADAAVGAGAGDSGGGGAHLVVSLRCRGRCTYTLQGVATLVKGFRMTFYSRPAVGMMSNTSRPSIVHQEPSSRSSTP